MNNRSAFLIGALLGVALILLFSFSRSSGGDDVSIAKESVAEVIDRVYAKGSRNVEDMKS